MNAVNVQVSPGPFVAEYGDLIWMGLQHGADAMEENIRKWISGELPLYVAGIEQIEGKDLQRFIGTLFEDMMKICADSTHEQIMSKFRKALVGEENEI